MPVVGHDNYYSLRSVCVAGDVLVCLQSDRVKWAAGKKYDVIRLEADSIVLSMQHFGEVQWLFPWGRNQKIMFRKIQVATKEQTK